MPDILLPEAAQSGATVPVPAGAPTPGQLLSATDDDPLTTDWIDALEVGTVAIYVSDTAPEDPTVNVVWIDTSGG